MRTTACLLVPSVLLFATLTARGATASTAAAGARAQPSVALSQTPAATQPISSAPTAVKTEVVPFRFLGVDKFFVEIYGEPDLSANVRVDANGNVKLKLIEDIKVQGLTVSEAEAAISKAYADKRFLRNAQVTITVGETRPRQISVQGQVKQTGIMPLPIEIRMTVADAVMKAGGFTEIAKESAVRVTRFSPDGKQVETFTVNVGDIIKGRMENKPVRDNSLILQPDDIIFVDERIF